MRNVAQPLPQQPMSQQQLNESIERTRAIMQGMKNLGNQEAVIANLLQQYPQLGFLSNAIRNGNSLEAVAQQIANTKGYDINQIISQLQGGL